MIESPDFADPVHGIPVFSLYGEVRRPTRGDARRVRRPARRPAGRRLPHLHVRHDAALRARGGGGARQGGVGARPAEPGRPAGRGAAPPARLGELRRRRAAADAPRPHARRAGALVRARASASTSSARSSTMEGWQPARGPGFGWPLGERAWVNPSPNAPTLCDGALLPGHGDARGHDALRGPRHDAAARAARRARPRRARRCSRRMTALAPEWLARLPAPPVLVRADLPQARGRALRRRPDPRRRPGATTTRRSGPGGSSRWR